MLINSSWTYDVICFNARNPRGSLLGKTSTAAHFFFMTAFLLTSDLFCSIGSYLEEFEARCLSVALLLRRGSLNRHRLYAGACINPSANPSNCASCKTDISEYDDDIPRHLCQSCAYYGCRKIEERFKETLNQISELNEADCSDLDYIERLRRVPRVAAGLCYDPKSASSLESELQKLFKAKVALSRARVLKDVEALYGDQVVSLINGISSGPFSALVYIHWRSVDSSYKRSLAFFEDVAEVLNGRSIHEMNEFIITRSITTYFSPELRSFANSGVGLINRNTNPPKRMRLSSGGALNGLEISSSLWRFQR